MFKLFKKKTPAISLKEHYLRRNKILIRRRFGGFGDILMQRMMFEDFKEQFPEIDFAWTVPYEFMGMALNHPFIETVEMNNLDFDKFGAIYDISTACRVYESKYAPPKIHRSDIWAGHCGVQLNKHEMHITPNSETNEEIKGWFQQINPENKPSVLLACHSTVDDFGLCKTLTDNQIIEVVSKLKELNFQVYSVHNESLPIYESLGIAQFTNLTTNQWTSLVHLSDYIISIDTSTFHLAGGLKKPLVGVFSFTDGKIYGKYYDFVLVQKHRDNGDWDCGPCFNYSFCPKSNTCPKPCMTELTSDEIIQGLLKAQQKWPLN